MYAIVSEKLRFFQSTVKRKTGVFKDFLVLKIVFEKLRFRHALMIIKITIIIVIIALIIIIVIVIMMIMIIVTMTMTRMTMTMKRAMIMWTEGLTAEIN